mgnify:CR=1 FL=1
MIRKEYKSDRLFVRVSPSEKALIREKARRAGMTITQYLLTLIHKPAL